MFLCCIVPPEVTPCQLVCQAEGGTVVAVRAPSVIDGTKCVSEESPAAVCIQGACTVSETLNMEKLCCNYILIVLLIIDCNFCLCSLWVVTMYSTLMHEKMSVAYVMGMVLLLLL